MKPKTNTDGFLRWLAFKLPRRLIYWCGIRMFAEVTSGKYKDQVVPELTAMDALDRWEKKV